jgi:hypothetical protein
LHGALFLLTDFHACIGFVITTPQTMSSVRACMATWWSPVFSWTEQR